MQNQANFQLYDAIILGGGASGLMCALTAAKRGLRIAIVDHNCHAGKKIAISGGGKCNFTNLNMGSAYYVGDTNFVEPALEAFSPKAMQSFFAKHGLLWEEREHGQLFGCQNAKFFVKTLLNECQRFKCHFFLAHHINKINKDNHIFNVTCHKDESSKLLSAKNLVLALGSPAWANVGATNAGLNLAAQWGHSYTAFTPALTSLSMQKNWPLAELSGISLRACISTNNYKCTDDLLFTHNGLSGPVTLQASCRWHHNTPIYINFLPHTNFEELLDAKECAKLIPRTLLSRHIPQRLADKLLNPEYARRKIAELSRKARINIAESVHNYSVVPTSKGHMEKAEAALGGICTTEVNPWSMESYLEKNLFIIGELLNITGHLGGYNLHFAFASGHLAGLNL